MCICERADGICSPAWHYEVCAGTILTLTPSVSDSCSLRIVLQNVCCSQDWPVGVLENASWLKLTPEMHVAVHAKHL